MPIYEVKNPAPLPVLTEQSPRKTEPAEKISPVIRVRHLKKEWPRRPFPGRGRQQKEAENEVGLLALRQMIDKINADFERGGIAIHLRLQKAEGTVILEIYDCSNGTVCEVLKDREITPAELSSALVTLQQETGLVIDTVS